MRKAITLQVDDIIEWRCSRFPSLAPRRWRVCGVHHGSIDQECLVELACVTHRPGWTGHYHARMFVPEALLRDLDVVKDNE